MVRTILNALTCLWPSARGYTSNWPVMHVKVGEVFGVGSRKLAR